MEKNALKILVNIHDDSNEIDATFGTGYGFYIELALDRDGTAVAVLKNENVPNYIGENWLANLAVPVVTFGEDGVQYSVENWSIENLKKCAYLYLVSQRNEGHLDDQRFRAA